MNRENNSISQNFSSLVEFNTAMDSFKKMFPNISSERIEVALRKNDGDIAATVDELLRLTSNSAPLKPTVDLQLKPQSSMQNTNCENDEKIALMLQNREFLRYLRSDQSFMRELGSNNFDHYDLAGPSKRHESVLSRCKRNHGTWITHKPSSTSSVGMDNERVRIPDGPMVDPCDRPLSRLSRKIKSKLPIRDNNYPRPEDMLEHTVTVDYETSDDRFVQKLKNMTSHSMFMNLARRFAASKNPGLTPNLYADQTHEFSYDYHQNAAGRLP
ncbi:CUE domain protein [Aphelenchoides besseyi]|nr:CUE domain protein [Aphelenchoides besseyi]